MGKLLSKILYGAVFIFSLLPLPLLYLLSDLIWLIMFICPPLRYRHKIVHRNLTTSFPEKSRREIAAIERRFYHNFLDQTMETFKLISISPNRINRRLEIVNRDIFRKLAAENKSSIVFMGHSGNWEWVTSIPLKYMDMGSDMPQFCQVYHKLENPSMDELILKIRSRFGCESIPMENTIRKLFKYQSEGRNFVCAMIADQVPRYPNIHYWTDFLNHYTPVFTGAERIVRKMNLVPMYARVTRPRRGHYRLEIETLYDDVSQLEPNAITEMFMRKLEEDIRTNPSIWLWSHNRWKRTWEGYQKWLESHPKSSRDSRKE